MNAAQEPLDMMRPQSIFAMTPRSIFALWCLAIWFGPAAFALAPMMVELL